MSGALIWLIVLFASCLAVFALRRYEIHKFTKGRQLQEIDVIRESIKDEAEFSAFRDVVRVIGSSYAIDPSLIRPDDSLESLARVDSWSLGGGSERLSDWLAREGITQLPKRVVTVADLAREVRLARDG